MNCSFGPASCRRCKTATMTDTCRTCSFYTGQFLQCRVGRALPAPCPNWRPNGRPTDQHVMPTYGREHDSLPDCWCNPTFEVLEHGTVWMHREEN
jgi:hypothetical protein